MPFLLRNVKVPKRTKLEPITLHGFSGGWNSVVDDQTLEPRYMPNAKNVFRTPSGSTRVRYGSGWFCDCSDVSSGTFIVDQEYFNDRIISVIDNGQIVSTDNSGVNTLIWSNAIAGALPGHPTGWGNTFVVCDFVPFRDKLIIHNGVDKPVEIASDYTVKYLQDQSSGSNVNVPIGKYGCVVSNYHCVAGLPNFPTQVYVSSKGTDGVFPGDPAPNDSIAIDVGAYAPEGANEIRGIAGFRTNLIIFFQDQTLVVTLGVYDSNGNHTPQFPDSMPKFGLLGHRCITKLANDLQFADLFGVCSAKRNLFSGLYDSKHLSEYVETKYRGDVGSLTTVQRRDSTFAIFDPIEHSTQVHLPTGKVYVYSANDELRYRAWTYYEDMTYHCGCTSALGRVFYGSGMKIFQKGNAVYSGELYTADMQNDRKTNWANATLYNQGDIIRDPSVSLSFKCLVTHTSPVAPTTFATYRVMNPGVWEQYDGEDISFDFESPWIDGRDPMKTKQLMFGKFNAKGTSEFTFRVYVDDLYKDSDGNEIYDPALEMSFIGQDADGFGSDAGPMGGGRPANDPRLYKLPVKFKRIKFRWLGSTKKPLNLASASFLFTKGKFKR